MSLSSRHLSVIRISTLAHAYYWRIESESLAHLLLAVQGRREYSDAPERCRWRGKIGNLS